MNVAGWKDSPLAYQIQAFYPNATMDPLTQYAGTLDRAIDQALGLMRSDQHTTISVRTPDSLEVVRLWGQVRGMP